MQGRGLGKEGRKRGGGRARGGCRWARYIFGGEGVEGRWLRREIRRGCRRGFGSESRSEGGDGRDHEPVECACAVEELEVEGGGCLSVDFASGGGLHGHVWVGGRNGDG